MAWLASAPGWPAWLGQEGDVGGGDAAGGEPGRGGGEGAAGEAGAFVDDDVGCGSGWCGRGDVALEGRPDRSQGAGRRGADGGGGDGGEGRADGAQADDLPGARRQAAGGGGVGLRVDGIKGKAFRKAETDVRGQRAWRRRQFRQGCAKGAVPGGDEGGGERHEQLHCPVLQRRVGIGQALQQAAGIDEGGCELAVAVEPRRQAAAAAKPRDDAAMHPQRIDQAAMVAINNQQKKVFWCFFSKKHRLLESPMLIDPVHRDPPVPRDKRGDRSGIDVETVKTVERQAERGTHGGFDDIAMGDGDDGVVCPGGGGLGGDVAEDALLDGVHGFAAGCAGGGAGAVPVGEARVVGKRVELLAGPFAEVDFIEQRVGAIFPRAEIAQRQRGFAGAAGGAGVDCVDAEGGEAAREAFGLGLAGGVDGDALHAAAEHLAEQVVRGVADQEQAEGHTWTGSAMKASVMAWASASVNCVGGDFMNQAQGPGSGPPMPRSSASLAQRIASMTTPAEFGLSPDFELEFDAERGAAEAGAFQPDMGPFAVFEPGHEVAGADMDVGGQGGVWTSGW